MHKKITIRNNFDNHFELTPDGKKKGVLRSIDQYPCLRANLGKSGFPANDVTLFNKLSSDISQRTRFESFCSHLHMVQASKDKNKGKSIQELIDNCMPAYIQKPAEVTRFLEFMSTKIAPVDSPQEKVESVSEAPEQASESKSE